MAMGIGNMGITWRQSLERAQSEHDVVALVREFTASFDAYEIESLPPHCRPGKFFVADDVTSYAFELVRYQCDKDQRTRELVHRIASFFADASSRLSQLMARPNDTDQEIARAG